MKKNRPSFKNFLALASAILVFSTQLNAQSVCFTVSPASPFTAEGWATSACVDDFNNDGNKDMAVAALFSGDIYTYLGNGAGGMGVGIASSIYGDKYGATSYDFNNDGKKDLAVSFVGNYIKVIHGNGAGSFSISATYTLSFQPNELAVSDLNGDGNADIVAIVSTNKIAVLLGNSAGSMTATAYYATGNDPRQIAIADVNNDGIKDIITANIGSGPNGILSVLAGTGTGAFGLPGAFNGVEGAYSVVAQDFNGDGFMDIVTGNLNSVSYFPGNGTGNYLSNTTIASVSGYKLMTGDYNQDGHADLAMANAGAPNFNIVLGNGNGTFFPYAFRFTSGSCAGFVQGDFNNDTKTDLVMVSSTNTAGQLNLYLNTVQPTVSVSGGSGTACAGVATTLTASGATTYSWSTTALTASVSVSPNTTTTYTLKATAANNCVVYAFPTVSVNPSPTITVNTATICAGQTATLTAGGAVSYSWNTGSAGESITVSPSTSTMYSVIGTSSLNCAVTKNAQVIVNPLPIVHINGGVSICSGGTGTLLASGGAPTYTWSNGSTLHTINPSPTLTTVYTVTGTSTQNCVNTQTFQLSVYALPTVTVNSPTICAGQTAVITASGAVYYSWSTGESYSTITPSPSSTTVYTVTGISNEGCVDTKTTVVTVNASPTLAVNASTICAGQTATLVVSGASTYLWDSGSTSATITPSPASTMVYTITGTAANCASTKTTEVVVNALPIITVTSPGICTGQTATVVASGASTYLWNTSSTSATITPAPAATTDYTVTGTSAFNCVSTKTTQVVVNATPTLTVNSPTICAGQTATVITNGAATYLWNTSSTSATISPSPAATTVYTVTGTSAQNCASTKTTQVFVNPLPAVSVNSPTICAGQTATLIAGGAATYLWNTSGVSATITPSPVVTTVYSVTGTSALNCANTVTTNITVGNLPVITVNSPTICAGETATLMAAGASAYLWNTAGTSATLTQSPASTTVYTVTGTSSLNCVGTHTAEVVVNPLPIATVNSPSICAGQTATLIAGGAATYSWNTGHTTATITASPVSSTVYTLTGVSALNCSTTQTTEVVVNSLPLISVNTLTLCAGKTATLTAQGAATYTWNTGDNTAGIAITTAATLNYTVEGSSAEGCTALVVSTVVVNPLPLVSLTIGTGTVCLNSEALDLSGLPAGGSFSGTGVSGNTFSASAIGSYTLTYMYTDANACDGSDSKVIAVDACTGINTIKNTTDFSMYPNPVTDKLQLVLEYYSTNYAIDLFDMNGRHLKHIAVTGELTDVNMTEYANGIYMIRVSDGANSTFAKFIKQ